MILCHNLAMQISVSIEPFLHAGKDDLKQYIEEIIALSDKFVAENQQISLHFDYFQANSEIFQLVQGYVNRIPIDLHLMSEAATSVTGFRSVCFDAQEIKHGSNEAITANWRAVENGQFGLVLDLGYQVQDYQDLIRRASYVIVMTVKCGKSGQVFQSSPLELVAQIREINPEIKVIIDGGVNENNVFLLKKAGVDIAVVGNYAKKCYENGNFGVGINRLLRD